MVVAIKTTNWSIHPSGQLLINLTDYQATRVRDNWGKGINLFLSVQKKYR